MKESKGRIDKTTHTLLVKNCKEPIEALKKAILELEEKMEALLKSTSSLSAKMEYAESVVGIGKAVGLQLLITTEGFSLRYSAKQLACYAGVAPFPHSSGSSVRGGEKVSHFANKELKSLLHMGALVASRYDSVLKAYYERKVGEGKSKMSVLNSIRNKLIHRVWACVWEELMYQKGVVIRGKAA